MTLDRVVGREAHHAGENLALAANWVMLAGSRTLLANEEQRARCPTVSRSRITVVRSIAELLAAFSR